MATSIILTTYRECFTEEEMKIFENDSETKVINLKHLETNTVLNSDMLWDLNGFENTRKDISINYYLYFSIRSSQFLKTYSIRVIEYFD
jgi:hypothetical protein